MTLLDRARGGDRQALDELFSRCIPPLQRWARGRLPQWARDMSETHDLVQDAVIQTLKHVDHFIPEREGALQAYLRQAILNRIKDEYRRAGRRPARAEVTEEHASEEASPLEQAIGAEALGCYEAAMQRLSPIEREAIIARLELGYSYEQVALAVGRPSADAARLAVRRALVHLAQEMKREA